MSWLDQLDSFFDDDGPSVLDPEEVWQERKALDLSQYQLDLLGYLRDILNVEPWAGRHAAGQRELCVDIQESVRRQLAGERGVPSVFRVEAGHGVGKTFIAAALVNWFFDAFTPSVTITTAPTADQVKLLLWKDIKSLRDKATRKLPGKVLPSESRMERSANHFAIGRTTNDSGGQGTNRAQGQHNDFAFFVLDEAEGVPEFYFSAVDAMMTGGKVAICLMIANPQTRTSEFHKWQYRSGVKNYRLSVLDFPNVLDGQDTIKGGTSREWTNKKILDLCERVTEHNPDDDTFTVQWDVADPEKNILFPAGTIFKPNPEFMFRVLGVAPKNTALDTFITEAQYEAARLRVVNTSDARFAQIGVDVARFGDDYGKIYRLQSQVLRHEADLSKLDSLHYYDQVKRVILKARAEGAVHVSVRFDGTGGFGSGPIDLLKHDPELEGWVTVHEVQFGASAMDPEKYRFVVTELYGHMPEALKGIRIERAPDALKFNLIARKFKFVNLSGHIVKQIESKDDFKKINKGRSPDDGDGAVLACAPEFLFGAFDYAFFERFSPQGWEVKQ